MGMFDWYRPAGEPLCPRCDWPLKDWQGKGGPNGLFVWAEGVAAPVDQACDEEYQIDVAARALLRLPPEFTIYSDDCIHRVEAHCRAPDGVWNETVMHAMGEDE